MRLSHTELLKMCLHHQKKVNRLKEIHQNIEILILHYKIECAQMSSKSITTLALINDAVSEMEQILEAKNTDDAFTQQVNAAQGIVGGSEDKSQVRSAGVNSTGTLSHKLAMLNQGVPTSASVSSNPPDNLLSNKESTF